MTLRALLIAVAAGLLLAAAPSAGQPPAEGKKEEGKSAFRLVKPLTLPHEGQVFSVAFSPDARLIASSTNGGRVRLWDARTGKLLWWRQVVESASVYQMAFSPDGKVLACPEMYAAVHLLDAATGKERAVLRHDERGHVSGVAFTPDGRWLVSGGRGLLVWDLRTHKKHRELLGQQETVGLPALSPDGKTVAAAWSEDLDAFADMTVRLWDRGTGKELRPFQDRDGMLTSLALSPCGEVLACGYVKLPRRGIAPPVYVVRLRDVATGRTTVKISDAAYGLAFSPDAHLLLVSGNGSRFACRLREAATGKEVHTVAPPFSRVQCVAFSPDGRAVALGTTDHTVLVQRLVPDLPGEGGKPLGADALARLWTDLGAEDPGKRYQAIWTLAAKPAEAGPFLQGRVERALPRIERAAGEGAVRVLELIDTPEARQLLRKLAAEAGARGVKQEATAALDRLKARARITPLTITPTEPEGGRP